MKKVVVFLLSLILLMSCNVTSDIVLKGRNIGTLQEVIVTNDTILNMLDSSIVLYENDYPYTDSVYFEMVFTNSKDFCKIAITAIPCFSELSMVDYVTSRYFFIYNNYLIIVKFVSIDNNIGLLDWQKDCFMSMNHFMEISSIDGSRKQNNTYKEQSYIYQHGVYWKQ